ncbi:MAG: hypothetical protein RLP44_29785 [Aggregatilineales bacterium]
MSDYENYSGKTSEARLRQRSRYTRPRTYISWSWLIVGVALGIVGGVFFAWNVAPVEEFDTVPRQLRMEDRANYVVAVMLDYNITNDLDTALQRLIDLNLPGDDPIQQVAEIACDLVSTGYASSSSGLRAVRVMMSFYQNLERSGCADELLPANSTPLPQVVQITVPTPTLAPPASKTPTPIGPDLPTATASSFQIPTSTNSRQFEYFVQSTFCDVELTALIEVRVFDFDGTPLPGQPIRVRWNSGESLFFTGLKPERGAEYADFQMEQGREYLIEMPGLSDPSPTPLSAEPCNTETGQQALRSYRIVFRPN